MQESEIIRLIARQQQGTISADDLARLHLWFDYSADNRRLYRYICLLYRKEQVEVDMTRFLEDKDKIWQHIELRIHQDASSTALSSMMLKKYFLPLLRYAAVIVVTVLLCFTGKYIFTSPAPVKMMSVSVPNGSLSHITLPDGSQVWLNSGSRISYSSQFGDRDRFVSLDGEGLFEVTHDKKRPFIVTSGATTIRVLGTRFDMKAYKGDPCQRITLIQGKLKVERSDGRQQVLKPGEQILLSHKLMRKSQVVTSDYITWASNYGKRGQDQTQKGLRLSGVQNANNQWTSSLIFDNEPLEQIVRDLGRAFNVDIQIQGNISDEVFYGDFRNDESLSQILDIIASTAHVRYSLQGNKVIIFK